MTPAIDLEPDADSIPFPAAPPLAESHLTEDEIEYYMAAPWCQDEGPHTLERLLRPTGGPFRTQAEWDLDRQRGPVHFVHWTRFRADLSLLGFREANGAIDLFNMRVWLHRQIKRNTGACSLYAEQIGLRCQRHGIVRDVGAVIDDDMLRQLLGEGQAFPLVP